MTFIKFRRPDAKLPKVSVEVAVAVEKIVAIEARYYQLNDKEERFDYHVSQGESTEDLDAKKLVRYFVVLDELGNDYHSMTASEAAHRMIAGLWADAK